MTDTVRAGSYGEDLDSQAFGNYAYDKTGNLIMDRAEGLRIYWTHYGKVMGIDSVWGVEEERDEATLRVGQSVPKLRFLYDALGNRVVKEYVPGRRREIYVRDAQGNVLAVYEAVGESLFTKEFYIWGMQRLGYLIERRYLGRRCSRPPCPVGPPVPVQQVLGLPPGIGRPSVVAGGVVELLRGSRRYELTDWLGNVRVVVTDRRLGSLRRGYRAEVVGVGEYYSFGQDIGERSYSLVEPYRYSFNGKEDIGEQRWWQDYGARLYHRGLGRFMSADPLIVGQKKYAWLSGYQFASASPVWAVDRDGTESEYIIDKQGKLTKPVISLANSAFRFSEKSLQETRWEVYNASTLGKLWFFSTGYPGAVVAGSTVYYHPQWKQEKDEKWLPLIVHEQSHREDVETQGRPSFYLRYLFEGAIVSYKEITTEKKAFEYQALAKKLVTYREGAVMQVLADKSLGEEEKVRQLRIIGLKFRLEEVVEPALRDLRVYMDQLGKELSMAQDFMDVKGIETRMRTADMLKGILEVEQVAIQQELERLEKQ